MIHDPPKVLEEALWKPRFPIFPRWTSPCLPFGKLKVIAHGMRFHWTELQKKSDWQNVCFSSHLCTMCQSQAVTYLWRYIYTCGDLARSWCCDHSSRQHPSCDLAHGYDSQLRRGTDAKCFTTWQDAWILVGFFQAIKTKLRPNLTTTSWRNKLFGKKNSDLKILLMDKIRLTTKDDDYAIIYRGLTIPGGAGFRPSTVSPPNKIRPKSHDNVTFWSFWLTLRPRLRFLDPAHVGFLWKLCVSKTNLPECQNQKQTKTPKSLQFFLEGGKKITAI